MIVGVAISNGVEVTARQAYELGFNVTLATGAMTDLQADAHACSGMMGQPSQSPFAKPAGKGPSSSTVNVLWGFANFVKPTFSSPVWEISICTPPIMSSPRGGHLLIGVMAARSFGRFHGDNAPTGS